MRTTVRLDPEVAAAAEQLRRQRHIGLGEAVNELARAGLLARGQRDQRATAFHQRTASVGLRIDVTNIAEALELLDHYDAEDNRTLGKAEHIGNAEGTAAAGDAR